MGIPERNGQTTHERAVLCPYPLPTLSERTASRLGDCPRFSEPPSNRLRLCTGGGRSRPPNPRSSRLCMWLHPGRQSRAGRLTCATESQRPHDLLIAPPLVRPPVRLVHISGPAHEPVSQRRLCMQVTNGSRKIALIARDEHLKAGLV